MSFLSRHWELPGFKLTPGGFYDEGWATRVLLDEQGEEERISRWMGMDEKAATILQGRLDYARFIKKVTQLQGSFELRRKGK